MKVGTFQPHPVYLVFRDLMKMSQSLHAKKADYETLLSHQKSIQLNYDESKQILKRIAPIPLNDRKYNVFSLMHRVVLKVYHLVCSSILKFRYDIPQCEKVVRIYESRQTQIDVLGRKIAKQQTIYDALLKKSIATYRSIQAKSQIDTKPYTLKFLEKIPFMLSELGITWFKKPELTELDVEEDISDIQESEDDFCQQSNFNQNLVEKIKEVTPEESMAQYIGNSFFPKILQLNQLAEDRIELIFEKDYESQAKVKNYEALFSLNRCLCMTICKTTHTVKIDGEGLAVSMSMGRFRLEEIRFEGYQLFLTIKRSFVPKITIDCSLDEFKEVFSKAPFV
jgi:hypothetical protein